MFPIVYARKRGKVSQNSASFFLTRKKNSCHRTRKAEKSRFVVRVYADKPVYFDAEMEEFRRGRDEFLDGSIGARPLQLPTFDMTGFPADALVGVSQRVEPFAKKLEGANDFTPAAAGDKGRREL